jgi:hypothetical protein
MRYIFSIIYIALCISIVAWSSGHARFAKRIRDCGSRYTEYIPVPVYDYYDYDDTCMGPCCNEYLDLGFGWGWDHPWGWSSNWPLYYNTSVPTYYNCGDCDFYGPYNGPYVGLGFSISCDR